MNLQMLKQALISYVNTVKFIWSELAYPLIIIGKKFTNLMDYKIHGNTVYGKNLMDVKKLYGTFANENGGITLHSGQLYNFSISQKSLNGVFKENTQYTFSFKYNITEATTVITPQFYYTDGTENHWYIGKYLGSWGDTLTLPSEGTYSFTSNGDKTLSYFKFTYGSNSGTRFECELTNMQFEEGVTATEYEPCNPQSVGDLTTKNLLNLDSSDNIYACTYGKYTKTEKGFNVVCNKAGKSFRLELYIPKEVFGDGKTYCVSHNGVDVRMIYVGEANSADDTATFDKYGYTSKKYHSFTIDTIAKQYVCFFFYGKNYAVGDTFTVENIQIEEGATVTEYEPYHKYKVPVTVRGKNILDMSKHTVELGYYSDSGGIKLSNNNYIRISPIKVEPNTTYRCSSNLGIYTFRYTTASANSSSFYIGGTYIGGAKTHTFTTPNGCYYVKISFYNTSGIADTSVFHWAMLEKGKGDGVYEPYIEPQTTNIYLDDQLEYSEVIQKTIDNLPELPQFKGTTIYEVGTSVEPSGIEVCYYE